MARYALVVGIAQYDNFRNLDKAATDAAAIARLLHVHGRYQVEPLPKRLVAAENRWELATDKKLTGKDLGQALETFLLEQANGHEVLIYFAGHGFEVPGLGRKKKGYLATSDCTSDGRNAILFSDLNDLIRESSLSSLAVVLDCCHAGSFLERTLLESTLTAFKEKKDYYLITACRSFERSREGEDHGVFTASVLKGLQPENADSEGVVTGDRLFDFVQRELRQSGQEPIRMGIGRSLILVTHSPQGTTAPEINESAVPYRGLAPFEKEQAEFFFGRKQVVEDIWKALDRGNFVAVIGASGSGKSSAVRAGLIPWLEAGGWQVLKPIKPGISPLTKLAAAFEPLFQDNRSQKQLDEFIHIHPEGLRQLAVQLPGSAKFLLVIDQFEEVFTLSRIEEQQRFVDLLTQLAEAPHSRLAVVTTMRADFLEPCLQYPTLTQLIQVQAIFMPPLIGADLEQAIAEPARKMGYILESGLLGDILQDVSQEPGYLPLLQFALLELWERRDTINRQLVRSAYKKMGNVNGALDRYAEQFYEELSKEKKILVKRICLKLIRPGKEEQDIRQRLPKHKFFAMAKDSYSQEVVLEVLTELINTRLLVTGEDSNEAWVDLAHEALMTGWKRFKDWRVQDRDLRRLIDRLENAFQEWKEKQTDENLIMGGLLTLARENWLVLESELDDLTKDFVLCSFTYEKNRIAQLQESEEKFSKAFRSSAVGMLLTSFEENLMIDVNDSFLKNTGYEREDLIGRVSTELNIWENPELRKQARQDLEKSGSVSNLEVIYRKKSGEFGVALISADMITLKGKRCVLASSMDITDRKRTEEALLESEEKFSKAFHASPAAMTLTNLKDIQYSYLIDANESFFRITGYQRQEVVGRAITDLNIWVDPISRAKMLQELQLASSVRNFEFQFRHKSGEIRVALLSAEIIQLKGKPYMLTVSTDITDQKNSEEALRESEKKFSIVFHSNPAAMAISELKDAQNSRILDVNDSFLRIVGFQREEIIGKFVADLNIWIDRSKRMEMLNVLQRMGVVRNFKMNFRRRSGEIGIGFLSCEKIYLKGEPCLLVMVIDVMDLSNNEKLYL